MKKLLCFILTFAIMASVAIIGVNAEENGKFTTYSTPAYDLIYVDTETNKEYAYLSMGINSDNSTFLLLERFDAFCDELFYQTIGDYTLFNPNTTGEIEGPFVIIKDNEVYGVTEAYENGLVEDKAFYNAMQNTIYASYIKLIGDTTNDGVLSIMDATQIQKDIADGKKFNLRETHAADYNSDNLVNINDATAIQKELVS